jgi:hypothetical protein
VTAGRLTFGVATGLTALAGLGAIRTRQAGRNLGHGILAGDRGAAGRVNRGTTGSKAAGSDPVT